jgi:hypothetical protein
MDYVTQYYKNLSEQLSQRVNYLSRKVKYLTESGGPTITDGNQGSGNTTVSPFGPGGYFYPSQLNPPTQNPNQSPSLTPYDGPGTIQPGHYSPAPPPSYEEWVRDWPYPNPDNYPGGANSDEYRRDVIARERAYIDWLKQWNKWREGRGGGAGGYRLPGPVYK